MRTVKTDCCGNVDSYHVGDTYSPTRVRVEGTCPVCGAVDPAGTIIQPATEKKFCACGAPAFFFLPVNADLDVTIQDAPENWLAVCEDCYNLAEGDAYCAICNDVMPASHGLSHF